MLLTFDLIPKIAMHRCALYCTVTLVLQEGQTRAHMTEISSFALINEFFLRGATEQSFLQVYVKPCEIRNVILSR